jgi:hypothetical protein
MDAEGYRCDKKNEGLTSTFPAILVSASFKKSGGINDILIPFSVALCSSNFYKPLYSKIYSYIYV